MRIAHLEQDSSLLLVTAKRLERLGYEHCVLPRVLSPEQIAAERDSQPIVAGELEVRLNLHQAFVDGRSLGLTRREFQLLELLVSYDKQVLERDFIYQTLWGYAMVRGDRSVDVFVRKVRHKLERASPEWSYVHTHFGIGYRFAAVPLLDEGETPLAALGRRHPSVTTRRKHSRPRFCLWVEPAAMLEMSAGQSFPPVLEKSTILRNVSKSLA